MSSFIFIDSISPTNTNEYVSTFLLLLCDTTHTQYFHYAPHNRSQSAASASQCGATASEDLESVRESLRASEARASDLSQQLAAANEAAAARADEAKQAAVEVAHLRAEIEALRADLNDARMAAHGAEAAAKVLLQVRPLLKLLLYFLSLYRAGRYIPAISADVCGKGRVVDGKYGRGCVQGS